MTKKICLILRILKYSFVLCLFFIACTPVFLRAQQPVMFSPLPMHSEAYVRREFYPFIQYIEKILQRSVEFSYQDNNIKVVTGLINDKIDLAFLGPLPMVELLNHAPQMQPVIQFLNQDGSVGYTCSIGVFTDSGLNLEDLQNKSIALTRPFSTCGYLMTEVMLKQAGLSLEDNQYTFLGQHPQCALAVIDGRFNACGIKTSIGQEFSPLGLNLIAESPRVPSFVLVANPHTLPASDIEKLRTELLKINPRTNPQYATLTADWGELIKYGTAPASLNDFSDLAEWVKNINIPGVAK